MSIILRLRYFLPLIFLPLILVTIWFRNGLITGGGEEGILFYNSKKTLELSTSVWVEYGTGGSVVGWLSKAPVIYLSVIFEKFGIPLFIFQLMLFYALMVIGISSVYYLVVSLADDNKNKNIIALVSAFFYLFNPYTFSQVWGRSLYTQYFAFALLPLTLLLFHLGIKRKKYLFGFLIAISSTLLAAAYGFLTFIVVYWFVLLSYFIFRVLTSQDRKKEILFGAKFIFFTFILWCLFNFWWFLPLLSSFGNFYSGYISASEHNLGTLLGVSKSYTPDIIIRLLHKGYFFDASAYSQIYSIFIFQLISFIPLIFLLIGLIKILRNKLLMSFRFFVVLLILGFLVSSGANPPFGWLFVWVFEHVTPLQAFRNPFEKFGLVYALGYCVIFAYGLAYFLPRWKFNNLLLVLVLILTCGVYAWPMWTGRVIAGYDKKIGLDIPTYYKDLRKWLENRGGDYRLLMTPIWAGDGAFYQWSDAARYQGIDPMVFMLDQSTISSTLRSPFYFEFISSIRKYMERENIAPTLSLLRVKFLVDRKDAINITDKEKNQVKALTTSIYPPQEMESNLKIICQNKVADSNISGVAWIVCQLPVEDSNLSNIRHLHLKVRTDIPANIEVAIRDSKGIRVRWDGRTDSDYSTDTNNWQLITVPLNSPTENNSEIDFSKIHIVEVLAHPKDSPIASVKQIVLFEIKLDPGVEKKINEFKQIAQFGELTVYEPINFNSPPEFGTLSQIDQVKDFIELIRQANKKRDQINHLGFLMPVQNHNKDLGKLARVTTTLEILDKQKVSNTRYWLRVEGREGEGLIILSKTFNPEWKILPGVSKEKLSGNFFDDLNLLKAAILPEENHFVVNGYANLWKVDNTNTQYAIVFMPQVIADISSKVSMFSIVIIIGLTMLWGITKLINRHNLT